MLVFAGTFCGCVFIANMYNIFLKYEGKCKIYTVHRLEPACLWADGTDDFKWFSIRNTIYNGWWYKCLTSYGLLFANNQCLNIQQD